MKDKRDFGSPRRIIQVRLFIAGLLLMVATLSSRAQAPEGASGIKKDLDDYHRQRLQEKIFVHTDKESYLAGEISWFRLYNVDAGLHRPMDLSKCAYLEWLDKDNKPVLQAKVALDRGRGRGSVYLPLTLRSGNYKLRAYTSWMKNSGPDWFFEKTITIVNARRSAEVPAKEPALQVSVAFFPEGGNLVENLESTVAFHIADQYGRGVACSGVITEDEQDTVIRFSPARFGIGRFRLKPRPGHHYRSTLRLADGTAISNLLPAAYREGMVMRVTETGDDRIRIVVEAAGIAGGATGNSATSPEFYRDGASVFLIAHTRQSVKLAETAILKDGKTLFELDKKALGEGISHLTVFNADRRPVCERLVFKYPSHHLQLALKTDQEKYGTRKKISLQIGSSDGTHHPAAADCSIAVYRLDSIQSAATGHIEPSLWLSSDLAGSIESPAWYFEHPEDEEAADNLMITHGWRRFRWEQVLQHIAPAFEFPPEFNGTIISGKIMNGGTGLPQKDVQTYLSAPGTRTQFSSAISDEEGQVRFELRDFYGSQELIAQTDPSADSLCRIELFNPFSDVYTKRMLPPFIPPLQYPISLADKSLAIQVLNRYGGQKLKRFDFPAVDTTVFYYKADNKYMLDDFTRFTTMEEVMREYVILMLVKRKGAHYHLPLFDLTNKQFFETDPLILLDGVPIFDVDRLMTLDPLKVRKLEVTHRKYFLGGTSYDGIMNWITYKGDLGGYILDPHATVVDYEGLQMEREFYAPSYDTGEAAESHLPDFRNVLYWVPELTTDSGGKGEVSFFSSDLPGTYLVVAEGLTADGSAGSSVARFEVR